MYNIESCPVPSALRVDPNNPSLLCDYGYFIQTARRSPPSCPSSPSTCPVPSEPGLSPMPGPAVRSGRYCSSASPKVCYYGVLTLDEAAGWLLVPAPMTGQIALDGSDHPCRQSAVRAEFSCRETAVAPAATLQRRLTLDQPARSVWRMRCKGRTSPECVRAVLP